MSENKGTGQIQIADEVISVIGGTAAMEVDGVYSMSGLTIPGGISEMFGKKTSKGIKISVEDGNVKANLDIVIRYGHKLHEVAGAVQKKVAYAIETMTGLNVAEVNVNVANIYIEKPKDKEKEETEV